MMFELDPILARDSHPIFEDERMMIRLIDDRRFVWVLIIPKADGVAEMHDLAPELFDAVMARARALGALLKSEFGADKINTAAIGNIVAQLHVHVVARTRGDAAWPAPVWGFGKMEPLTADEAKARAEAICRALTDLS